MPDRPLYIHSLFVSYPKEVPSAQRIPYTAGAALDPDLLSRLARLTGEGRWREAAPTRTPTVVRCEHGYKAVARTGPAGPSARSV